MHWEPTPHFIPLWGEVVSLDCTKVNSLRILFIGSWGHLTSRKGRRSGVTSCRGKWPRLGLLLLLYCQLDGFVYNVTASVRHPEAVMLQPTWVKHSMECLPSLLLLPEIHYPLEAITCQWAKREGFDTIIMADARLCMWTVEDLFSWIKRFWSLQRICQNVNAILTLINICHQRTPPQFINQLGNQTWDLPPKKFQAKNFTPSISPDFEHGAAAKEWLLLAIIQCEV